jgi:hypothetical protein
MQLSDIFYDPEHRNIFLKILFYLSYDDLCNIYTLDKLSNKYLNLLIQNDEHKKTIKNICLYKYFDRKEGKFLESDLIMPSSSIDDDLTSCAINPYFLL